MAELDREELSELGEAYRDKLDVELRPTRTGKEVDWAILLTTSEMRRSLLYRYRRLGAAERLAVIIVPIAALLGLGWLLSIGLRAMSS